MAKASYQRIGGTSRNFLNANSLWLGSDHLLQAVATLGIENYRRWYLREVQAVLVRRTGKRAMWNVIWGILGGLALSTAAGFVSLASTSARDDGQIPLYVFAGISGAFALGCGAIILWNSLLGPTCAVFVQTTAGLQPLAAPTRQRAADALFVRLRPLIEAAQLPDTNPA